MNRPFLRQYITVNILIILVSELNEDRLIGPSYRYLLLGSLSNDDGDGNENSKKGKRLRLEKTTTLHMHHAFMYISLPSLHDYNAQGPNFTFCQGREHKRTTFSFFC